VYRVRIEAEAPAIRQGRSEVTSPLLPLPNKPSLVVLPFINMSRDPEQEYFSDGITEDITTDLSRISRLSRSKFYPSRGRAGAVIVWTQP
jgi:TolB-like protein